MTGELVGIDHSDNTSDITFSYDRLGRKQAITDSLGIRNFSYTNILQFDSEHLEGEHGYIVKRNYDRLGRTAGFMLNDFYTTQYNYDDAGRFAHVGWQVNDSSDAVQYTYTKDSDLLAGLSSPSGISSSYSYEPHRNLKTGISNTSGDDLISRYEYQYDRLGRRVNVKNSGKAFNKFAFNLYDYNTRNELVGAERFLGTNIKRKGSPVKEQHYSYSYDAIGNRNSSQHGDVRQ